MVTRPPVASAPAMRAGTGVSPRRFGFTIGAVALVVAWWLVAPGTARLLMAGVGVLLVSTAMVVPQLLTPIARLWMALGHAIGLITTPIIFTVLWVVAFVPVGWLRRTFSRSPLARDRSAITYWVARPDLPPDARRRALERQF